MSQDGEIKGWRWQIVDAAGKPEGDVPHRYLARCLKRLAWLNLVSGEVRYRVRPVRDR